MVLSFAVEVVQFTSSVLEVAVRDLVYCKATGGLNDGVVILGANILMSRLQ